jgi:cation diffusion facilitator CzcD-associated flavoprotein CzcO
MDTDYLVIGAGAMGMAFADALLAESNADVLLVDRHYRPGGHWNDAYPFVRLHQASAFYGKDAQGLNRGLYEVATAAEISGYFDQVIPPHRCHGTS